MRYKQRRRKSTLVVEEDTIDEIINGKVVAQNGGIGQNDTNNDQIDHKNDVINEESNDLIPLSVISSPDKKKDSKKYNLRNPVVNCPRTPRTPRTRSKKLISESEEELIPQSKVKSSPKAQEVEEKKVVTKDIELSEDIEVKDNSNDNEINDENEDTIIEENSDQSVVKKNNKKSKKSSVDTSWSRDLILKLKENNEYFSSLIDLIPAKIYFEGNEEILESMEKQKRDLFGDDLDLSKKSKQKRFKLDPNSGKKISEIANNFYNKSNKNSKQNQSTDNKMEELKKKLNEKIMRLKSVRGQKRKNQRESKKERKMYNSMRSSKQKGFSKRKFLDTNDDKSGVLESKPKKVKSEDTTDGTDNQKTLKNMPKIYNKEGNIVYSKFDLVSSGITSLADKKKNSKKNNLKKLLVKTKKEEQKLSELEVKDAPKAQEVKEKKMWRKAIDMSEGVKVRDNSKLIKKSLINKRKNKLKSAKNWGERKESLEKTMASKQDKRMKNISDRKHQKKDKKLKRMKKRGHILDMK